MPARPIRDLMDGGGSVIGRGKAPEGTWTLRAAHEPSDADAPDGYLSILLEEENGSGRRVGSGGCGGIGLANGQRPVVLSMSRQGLGSSICYVGQCIREAERVVLGLTDGATVNASVLTSELPVRLWVAFTDGTAVATSIRAYGEDGLVGMDELEEHWPDPRSNGCWGPLDFEDEDDE